MKSGVSDPRLITQSDLGTGPATSVSPSSLAPQECNSHTAPLDETFEDTATPAFELQREFRRRLAGARQYRGQSRAAARRAAHQWYVGALTQLNERMRLARAGMRQRVAARMRLRNTRLET